MKNAGTNGAYVNAIPIPGAYSNPSLFAFVLYGRRFVSAIASTGAVGHARWSSTIYSWA